MAKSAKKTPGGRILSKSRLMEGLQCEKRLFYSVYQPGLAEEVSASQQAIFDQGNEVGDAARKQFPDGVMITANHFERELALKLTQDAIASGAEVLYEAAFLFEGFFCRLDILRKTSGGWDIIEVKSTTSVKEEHINDLAIQKFITEGAGLKIKSASLMHLNSECVYPDLKNLFATQNLSREVEELIPALKKNLAALHNMIMTKLEPKREIGEHCSTPYECQFKDHCWSKRNIPQVSVFNIPRLSGEKKWELFNSGRVALSDVDASELNETQARMVEVTVSGERFIDSALLRDGIKKWEFPLHYLDFETVAFAIPRFEGTSPYQQIPFQFSCHVEAGAGRGLEHREFLHTDASDPREAFVQALVAAVGEHGSIVSYNKGFEGGVISKLSEMFPQYRKQLSSMVKRLVDPLPLFRAGVYDPKFEGSFSIKYVAPALVGDATSYDGMPVGDGEAAQLAYKEMISAKVSAARKSELREALLKYCEKDTMNMVRLVEWLRAQA